LRSLGRAARVVLAAAGSLFALLLGIGTLLFASEGAAQWGSFGWIAAGLGLAFMWLPALRAAPSSSPR
jgi:Na+/phosphate symporter